MTANCYNPLEYVTPGPSSLICQRNGNFPIEHAALVRFTSETMLNLELKSIIYKLKNVNIRINCCFTSAYGVQTLGGRFENSLRSANALHGNFKPTAERLYSIRARKIAIISLLQIIFFVILQHYSGSKVCRRSLFLFYIINWHYID